MKRRSIFWMVVLFVVTLGIYRLYWLVKTRAEMLAIKPKLRIPSALLVILPVVLFVFSIAVLMSSGNHQRLSCQLNLAVESNVGSAVACTGDNSFSPATWTVALFYLACALYLPLQLIFLWGYSHAVSDITKDKMSFPLTLLLLLVLPFGFDILLVQEAFNDVKKPVKKVTAATA